MVYEWKKGSRLKCDAQVAGEFIENLGGVDGVTSEQLLDASRDENSPLHNEFEWDDTVAAEEYRKNQARYILRSITVTIVQEEKEEYKPRAFNLVIHNEKHVYRPMTLIMQDKDEMEQVYQKALSELAAIRQKYCMIEKLRNVFCAIDEELKKR